MPTVAPRRTRLPLRPEPGARPRVVLDLSARARRAQERAAQQAGPAR